MINSETDLRTYVSENAGIPIESIEEIETPSRLRLADIDLGLLVVFARWSPIPLVCLRRMKGLVAELLSHTRAKMYIIDNDKLQASDMQRIFGRYFHGGAESFAVVRGEIRGESLGCLDDYELVLRGLFKTLAES